MLNLDLLQLARAGGRTALNEMEGKALLAGYGIDVPHSVRVADVYDVSGIILTFENQWLHAVYMCCDFENCWGLEAAR